MVTRPIQNPHYDLSSNQRPCWQQLWCARLASDHNGPQKRATAYRPLFYVEGSVKDEAQWAVVASNAGSDRHPHWWLNLQANPAAHIQIEANRYKVTARLTSGEEQNRLWVQFVELFAGYATYQQMTERELPVVMLETIA